MAAVTLLTSCTTPAAATFDPQRTDVRLARSQARVEVTSTLSRVVGNRSTTASAWMDRCDPGRAGLQNNDPWSRRCSYEHSVALTVADMATAQDLVESGLEAARCESPMTLSDQLDSWDQANPGEPAPGDEDFQPGVVAPALTDCAGGQLWIRLTSPTDPHLDRTLSAAASTTSPMVVSAQPYDSDATEELRGTQDPVIVVFSLNRPYHEEPR